MSYLVVAQKPDGSPVTVDVGLDIFYYGKTLENVAEESVRMKVEDGVATGRIAPPPDAAAMIIEASTGDSYASVSLQSGHSPSDSFIHLEQVTRGPRPRRRLGALPRPRHQGGAQLLLRGALPGHGALQRRRPTARRSRSPPRT